MDHASDIVRTSPRFGVHADTPSDIERDIALTRNRVSDALGELERKVDPRRALADHPVAAVAIAFTIGVVLGTRNRASGASVAPRESGKTRGVLYAFADRLVATAATAAAARLFPDSSGGAPLR